MTVEEVEGRTAPEPLLRALHLVESEADDRKVVDEPRSVDEAIASYRNPGTIRRRAWLAARDGEPLGAAFLSDYGGTLVIGYVLVRPAFRRGGIGRLLFERLTAEARAAGVGSFFGQHASTAGAAFAGAMGAEDGERSILSVLDLRSAALPAPAPPPGVELRSWIGAAPDDVVDSLVRARNAMADAPVPGGLEMPAWTVDSQRQDEERWLVREMPQHVTVARERGDVVALTGVRVPDRRGVAVAYTDDTTTIPSARRRGLARAVKLENLRRLRAGRPDVERVATQNAAENEAMLSLNLALGFVPVLTLTSAVVTL